MNVYEKKIIGGISCGLIKPSATGLDASDFSDKDLGVVFNLAYALESEGAEIDAEVLYARTVETNAFYTAEDFRLMEKSAHSRAVCFDAIKRIKESALKTYLLEQAAEIALQENRSGALILDSLKKCVQTADRFYSVATNSFQSIAEIEEEVKAVLTDLKDGKSFAVPTFYKKIDESMLDGFSLGDLHLIVGFTGHGKSALALNYALNQAKNGYGVGIVSREMSKTENVIRLLAAESGVKRYEIRREMATETYERLINELKKLTQQSLFIDTSIEDVETLCRETARMVDECGLSVLYVDYLQLLTSKANSDTRANEVQTISRELKKLAMNLNIPVVALVQFNNGALNASLFDVINHIRESGSIKQDASTIQYIQIEHSENAIETKQAKLNILKNRNGETFKPINLTYKGAEFKFYETFEDAHGIYNG